MRRKVIQLSGNTSVVSLPSNWVKQNKIKKGNELEVEESGNELLIKSSFEKGGKKVILDVSEFNEMSLRYAISAMHKTGYDEFTFLNPGKMHLDVIHDMTKNLLLSFIVAEHTNNRIVLRSVAIDSGADFDSALRRAFLVTLSLADSSLGMVRSGELSNLMSLIYLEKSNNQLTSFCLRLINKGYYKNPLGEQFISNIIWLLEKIGDDYKHMCVLLSKNNIKISKDIIDFYSLVNYFFKSYYELFYKFEIQKLNDIAEKRFDIIRKIQNIKTNNAVETNLISHLNSIFSKTADLSSSLFGLRHSNLKECKQDFQ